MHVSTSISTNSRHECLEEQEPECHHLMTSAEVEQCLGMIVQVIAVMFKISFYDVYSKTRVGGNGQNLHHIFNY